ncbi:putative phosphatidate phosphatase isoform X2 [Episyrphus balteatus]|uniref:putative phosphatidate phosphatase isoform X2 n=1 Tax=Episyrphus balteatus TaxID=286459 RepID=UPI0024866C8E|nr:putative phosphatidate phosphatase isoform X2 [Episyrphus balteatus]
MSSELSVSETTPLRRPDLSDELSTSTPTRSVNVNVNHNNHNNHHQTATNGSINNKNSNSSNHTRLNNNNHNNNNIEIDSAGIHRIDNNNCDHNSYTMETNKRILCRIGTDVLILMCVGFPILLFFLLGDPYKRGFFCDDESLMHPFHESTVKSWMLYIIGLVIPVGIVIGVELVKSNMKQQSTTNRRFVFNGWEVPEWMIECYKKLGVFGFGAAMCQLATDIAKYSIGRLRPHFFAVCQPIMRDGTNCSNPINAGRYIEEFTCLGINSTPRMLKEVRLSFPSGHSSFSTFTMVYMALYLQSRMNWKGSKLLKHFLQFLLIMIAWYTALSRVSDYKHHWSDVLSGMTIGSLFAVIVARFTPTNWFNWYTVWPQSKQTKSN